MKKVQTGLRLSEELNRKTAEEAKKLEISKNDYILLAIQEKLKRDQEKIRS
ncbi:MAG TPA: type II toxin-antitoxin system HicB family antitoxin [Candidatus Mediterraneibacter intestinipullorum]|nr:type II toxin-antitoxin system HicB family antitoxin [Candidatus Mediterraneibacter intestinipullorum]